MFYWSTKTAFFIFKVKVCIPIFDSWLLPLLMDHLEHIPLFETNFMPHGHCYFWSPDIVWTNTIADSIIALSYFIIPIALIRIARKRNDINFRPLLFLFGIFIIACGTTHIIDIITIWKPIYRVGSTVKAITALASLPTAIILIKLVPNIISIPSNHCIGLPIGKTDHPLHCSQQKS